MILQLKGKFYPIVMMHFSILCFAGHRDYSEPYRVFTSTLKTQGKLELDDYPLFKQILGIHVP